MEQQWPTPGGDGSFISPDSDALGARILCPRPGGTTIGIITGGSLNTDVPVASQPGPRDRHARIGQRAKAWSSGSPRESAAMFHVKHCRFSAASPVVPAARSGVLPVDEKHAGTLVTVHLDALANLTPGPAEDLPLVVPSPSPAARPPESFGRSMSIADTISQMRGSADRRAIGTAATGCSVGTIADHCCIGYR